MQKSFSLRKFRYYSICSLLLAGFLVFSNMDASSQIYRKRSERNNSRGRKGKIEFKRNIIWLEGLGASGVVGARYERIFMFGSVVSMRFNAGVTPFVVDEKYNFIAGRSITPVTGLGFYFHIMHSPIRIGAGFDVLHDIFFKSIPETFTTDSTKHYGNASYRVRFAPYIVIEATIKERFTIKAGYVPLIDPPNHAQTDLYLTHFGTIGFGYKFGR